MPDDWFAQWKERWQTTKWTAKEITGYNQWRWKFGAASYWEEVKGRPRRWWQKLQDECPGAQHIVLCNAAVLAAWKVAAYSRSRKPYNFLLNWTTQCWAHITTRPVSLFLAWFSHSTFLHCGMNMYLLGAVGPALAHLVDGPEVLTTYALSGLCGSLAMLAYQAKYAPKSYCMGASACVLGTWAAYATLKPNAQLKLFGSNITLTAQQYFILFFAADIAWCLAGVGRIAWPAHVAGALAGYVWAQCRLKGVAEEKRKRWIKARKLRAQQSVDKWRQKKAAWKAWWGG
eukprot:TRINITY_DN95665_c0_g1_i1.p1 TRINITY_DN95665_c0_g1~~TRINITY_DN95665_c0_g1_i1.p1  ORF type:complete len:294 (-),score=12.61 TRINITY_DN95665_c0_g1_i1:152-1012(-)